MSTQDRPTLYDVLDFDRRIDFEPRTLTPAEQQRALRMHDWMLAPATRGLDLIDPLMVYQAGTGDPSRPTAWLISPIDDPVTDRCPAFLVIAITAFGKPGTPLVGNEHLILGMRVSLNTEHPLYGPVLRTKPVKKRTRPKAAASKRTQH